jgi:hypothetical protein
VERVGNLALRGMPLQPGGDGGEDEGDEEPGAGGGVGAAPSPPQGGDEQKDYRQHCEDVFGRHAVQAPISSSQRCCRRARALVGNSFVPGCNRHRYCAAAMRWPWRSTRTQWGTLSGSPMKQRVRAGKR